MAPGGRGLYWTRPYFSFVLSFKIKKGLTLLSEDRKEPVKGEDLNLTVVNNQPHDVNIPIEYIYICSVQSIFKTQKQEETIWLSALKKKLTNDFTAGSFSRKSTFVILYKSGTFGLTF